MDYSVIQTFLTALNVRADHLCAFLWEDVGPEIQQ